MKRTIQTLLPLALLCAFTAVAQEQQPQPQPERKEPDFAARFAKLDKNSDGKLDKSEMAGNGKAKNSDRRFSRADANSDGAVSKEEFVEFAKKQAARARRR